MMALVPSTSTGVVPAGGFGGALPKEFEEPFEPTDVPLADLDADRSPRVSEHLPEGRGL